MIVLQKAGKVTRTRTFDPGDAVEKAMNLFWQRGYAETSVDNLVSHTGVSRKGLYTVFGNKRKLFVQALQEYRRAMADQLTTTLEAEDASLPQIRRFFHTLAGVLQTPAGRNGCLVCNTALERISQEKPVADEVRTFMTRLQAGFRHALSNAQAKGEVAQTLDAAKYATFLTSIVLGIAVLSKSPIERGAITDAVEVALAKLT